MNDNKFIQTKMIDKMTNGLMEMKDVIKSRRLELGPDSTRTSRLMSC